MAFSLQRTTNDANRTPQTVTPIQMIEPVQQEGPPSKILRIKAKERLGTKKPEFVYESKPKGKIDIAAEVEKQPQKEKGKEMKKTDNIVTVQHVNIPKRLQFSKNCKMWHNLRRADQRQVRLINNKNSRYETQYIRTNYFNKM